MANSLKDVYHQIVERDQEKVAQVEASEQLGSSVLVDADPELLKQAQEWDQVGRILAHHVFTDMVKEAIDAMPEGEEKEKTLAAFMGGGEDKEESEEDKKRKKEKKEGAESEGGGEGEGEEEEEKKASLQRVILNRMAQDPEYVSELIAKHYPA